jgi:DNA segregation ATPase FtsK/SpoIIIE, S-DNA-T family
MRYAAAGASTLTQYRSRSGAADEPRVLVLLDGVAAFRQAYEIGERSRWFDMLVNIAADGRGVGVHLAISADRPASVPSALGSSIQRRVVLRMADDMEYALLGLPTDVLGVRSPAGRALFDGYEVQIAVLGGSNDVFAQAEATAGLAESMKRAGVSVAPGIVRLSEEIPLGGLPATVGELPTLGMESDELAPIGFTPSGSFLVAGPPGSGRTTALVGLEQSLRRWNASVRAIYFGTARSQLAGLETWDRAAVTPEEAVELATELSDEIAASANGRPIAIFVEGAPDFINTVADVPLQDMLKVALDHGVFVVGEGETSALAGSYPLQQLVKSYRTGIALQPDQVDGTTLFKTGFPRANRADFPFGRGFYVSRGKAQVVQLPLPK